MDATGIVSPLVELLKAHADAENAVMMRRYMRDQFDFLGIKTPERRRLTRDFLRGHRDVVRDNLPSFARDLWTLPEREFQYVGVDLLDRFGKRLGPADLPTIEYLVTKRSWWDTVDGLATRVIGGVLRRDAPVRDRYVSSWRMSDNMWLRRVSILFQLKYKSDTDVDLLFSVIRDNIASDEFFIRKAIGWALREHSKTDANAVIQFVSEHDLSPLSKREALKWLQSR